jgi:heat shock protein HslJ
MMKPQQGTRRCTHLLSALLIAAMLVTLVSAAAGPARAADPLRLKGAGWVLVGIAQSTVTGDVRITARFSSGRVTGSTGVHDYYAAYEAHGDRLTIKRIGTTREAAGTPETLEQERLYLALLADAATYRVVGHRLEIRNDKGELKLIYRAATPFWRGAERIRAKRELYETGGCVMVPFRPIAEWLGATVKYTAGERTVQATTETITARLAVGSRQATVNGKTILLPHVPSDGRGELFVPLSFMADAFGVKADWFPDDQVLLIRAGARKGALYPGRYWHDVIAETRRG